MKVFMYYIWELLLALIRKIFLKIKAIGRAACQSSSFWWPRLQTGDDGDFMYYGQYYFLNNTLYTNLDNRPRQWILIDVGELEEGDYTHVSSKSLLIRSQRK